MGNDHKCAGVFPTMRELLAKTWAGSFSSYRTESSKGPSDSFDLISCPPLEAGKRIVCRVMALLFVLHQDTCSPERITAGILLPPSRLFS